MSAGSVPGSSPLAALRRVRVGSTSEPKLEAVRTAFAAYAPHAAIEGVAVASGVSEQPLGFDEIARGARNRALRASEGRSCELAVGIEDGLVALPAAEESGPPQHLNVGCAAVTDGRRTALGFSSAFAYPPACSDLAVRARRPIGPLFDRLWAYRRCGEVPFGVRGRAIGNVGKLTLGVLPRSEYARHAVLCALVSFLHPDLYDLEGGPPERSEDGETGA